MRPLLNTLYITTDGAWLRKDGENLVMEVDGEQRARVPVHMLQGLVCIGRVLVSPPLMGYCAERGITISYLSPNGKFLARVEGPVSGNVLLRRAQYRQSDGEQGMAIARHMVIGKIFNQRAVLARAVRDHSSSMPEANVQDLQHAVLRLRRITDHAQHCNDLDTLRGLEGDAAQLYFGVFDHLIRVPSPAMRFHGRSRRPPRDAVNALLSLLYTLLTHDCRSALETVGLDPAVGFLHRDRPGRPSLALDVMEEFRPVLADRLALSLINRKQIGEKDFQVMDNGAVLLKDEARKTLLVAWQERKRESLQHSFIGEAAPIGIFPFLQAQLLARHLRGDVDAYPPFIWK
ncbi:type I-C CRISPR-associated endonuclease Cas1 [Lampropedia puyangensis]|uniref:CRISPR-associated endonuclease Cas1 n=1 Tax=Lampropedia puyangensis TaxID=1330072 RepID=A0A4S8FA57_9BURK|nr:type I-C CRISPR-associated endonuclease Cas1c [Lampropedia puyangensis]THU04478.1 type I-C CRISPR-associated endonuclease Cas1 [Lampropedia puyangensis]